MDVCIPVGAVGVRKAGTWYLDTDKSGSYQVSHPPDASTTFAGPIGVPILGDWDGDGCKEIGMARANGSNLEWHLDANSNGLDDDTPYPLFGLSRDKPLVGDWDGDGVDEIGVRSLGGNVYLDTNGNGQFDTGVDAAGVFGESCWTSLVGDWDGDGKDQIGVYTANFFYLDMDQDANWDGNVIDKEFQFGGTTNWFPLVGDWNGDGKDEIGTRVTKYIFLDWNGNYVWNDPASGGADIAGEFGDPAQPFFYVVSDWDADGAEEIGAFSGTWFFLDMNGNAVWNGDPPDSDFQLFTSGEGYEPFSGRGFGQ